MNPLYNVVANLHGTDFLLFYGFVIIVTYIVCATLRRLSDRSAAQPLPVIPTQPDAYEIAYLRSGESEVARVVVFSLIQRGLLQTSSDGQQIEQVPTYPYMGALSPLEQHVFSWFSMPRSASEIFRQSSPLVREIKPFTEYYREHLSTDDMLTTPTARRNTWLIWLFGAIIIVGLGVYKLQVAAATGHSNTGFTTLMLISSFLILFAVCHAPRQSARGKAYLQQLQLAFSSIKEHVKSMNDASVGNTYMLAVGLFGTELLTGTQYGYFHEMYQSVTSSSSSDGGGGGGCGGGGCGGGGCGGA